MLRDDSRVLTCPTDIYQHLEFDITDDDHFLHINGQPVFPPPKTLIPVALTAAQIRTSDQSTTEPLRLGYALEVSQTKSDVTDITLHPIQLTILDLNGVAVKVDTVKLDVIQSWGKLHIARITRIPYAQSPGAGICTTSLCRLRAIIATRLRQMIDAARTHAGNAKTWIKNGCSGRKHAPGNVQQDQQNPPHHGHGHHGQGRLRRFFQKTVHFSGQVIHFFILPALFGVAGGLVACALGMLVGQAVASCMNRRSRRAGAGVAALTADGEIAISDEEKDVLVENGEMPPQYEDVDVVVVEEK